MSSVTFHNVFVFQYFNTPLARYTEVIYQLQQSFFFMNIKFNELLSETGNVLQKRRVNLTMSA